MKKLALASFLFVLGCGHTLMFQPPLGVEPYSAPALAQPYYPMGTYHTTLTRVDTNLYKQTWGDVYYKTYGCGLWASGTPVIIDDVEMRIVFVDMEETCNIKRIFR